MSKWIEFALVPPGLKAKTHVWLVWTKDGAITLGRVRWFSRWRQYCFQPEPHTVFERQCLRDIATFCEDETKKHRDARKAAHV